MTGDKPFSWCAWEVVGFGVYNPSAEVLEDMERRKSMTDRLKGFIVTLDDDIREDDAEAIINAIRMIRRVADVQPLVTDHDDYMARVRVRDDLFWKVKDIFFPEFVKDKK